MVIFNICCALLPTVKNIIATGDLLLATAEIRLADHKAGQNL
jgi:hypothetical protein